MSINKLTKSIFILIIFVLSIFISSFYLSESMVSSNLLANTNNAYLNSEIDINEKEINANKDDFKFFSFDDYTLIFSNAEEPNNGWYLLDDSTNKIILTSIGSYNLVPEDYVSRNENYIHFRNSEGNYFYNIETNETIKSSNNWRYDYSIVDASYIKTPPISLGGKRNYINKYYIAKRYTENPEPDVDYGYIQGVDNPLFSRTNKITSNKDIDYIYNIINTNDDFLIIENKDVNGTFNSKGDYTYINLNQALIDDGNGNITQRTNNGGVIKINNIPTENDDGANNWKYEELTPLTKNWIKNPALNQLYYYDNINNYLNWDKTINYQNLYGDFNNNYEIYQNDGSYFMLNLEDNQLNPYTQTKINNLSVNNIEQYVQTPNGNYYFIESTSNSNVKQLRFVDSQKLLKDPMGDLISNSAIVARYEDPTNDLELLYATDFEFYYLEDGILKTSTFPWINSINYEGNFFAGSDQLYFDQNLQLTFSKGEINNIYLSSPSNDSTIVNVEETDDLFIINFEIPNYSYEKFDLRIDFVDSNLMFSFPNLSFYKNYQPSIKFSSTSYIDKYVTKEETTEGNALFTNIISSDDIINISIDNELISKVKVNYLEWDTFQGKFESSEQEDYLSADGFWPSVGQINNLVITDQFGKEWYYKLVVDYTGEYSLPEYFKTDEGINLIDTSESNGYKLPNDINNLNSLQVEALYNHSLNITDLGLIPNYDDLIQRNLGEYLDETWYNPRRNREKLPLNRLNLDSLNIDGNQTLKDAIEESVISSINYEGYLNSINHTNLTKDDIDVKMNTQYLNWNTIITIESIDKMNTINSFELKIDQEHFNYYDISNYQDQIEEEINLTFNELIDNKDIKKGMEWQEAEPIITDSIVETLNEFEEPWSNGIRPTDDEFLIASSDIWIDYRYHEEDIVDDTILNDIEYIQIRIESNNDTTSIVYDNGKQIKIKVTNNLFDTAGFLFYYKEIILVLILLLLLIILIVGTIFLIPWIRHSRRLKEMKKMNKGE